MSSGLPGRLDAVCVLAANPGPMTLWGTNTWVVGRRPAWVVDPGPDDPSHLDAVAAVVADRGGAGGIAVTHDHADHAAGVAALSARLGDGVPVFGFVPEGRPVRDGEAIGPLRALALPGHCEEHFGFTWQSVGGLIAFTGDAVLGEGSVFVAAAMGEYLAALARLRDLEPRVLCPGHGPVVTDPHGHLDGYIAHRLEREARVLAALGAGIRDEDALLDSIWGELGPRRRRAAAATLRAHLEKLRREGRLPA